MKNANFLRQLLFFCKAIKNTKYKYWVNRETSVVTAIGTYEIPTKLFTKM